MNRRHLLLTAAILLIDQGIKQMIIREPYGRTIAVWSGVLEITHYANTGAAFSLLSGRTLLIILFSVGLFAALFVLLMRHAKHTRASAVALAVLAGGGLGNLFDRVARGAVTDYIRFLPFFFPVFNFADICITVSVAFLFVQMLTGQLDPQGKNHESNH